MPLSQDFVEWKPDKSAQMDVSSYWLSWVLFLGLNGTKAVL